MKDYKELIVWQKSMDLVTNIYNLVKLLPKEETYALSDQIRRSAVSVPSNIAEGYERGSDKEFAHFLYIALGSIAELETQIILCNNLKFIDDKSLNDISCEITEIRKMIKAFIKKIANG